MYDIIIIGAGFGGYSAAIYAQRYNLKTLIIGRELGGTIVESHIVENYPGYRKISGLELMNKFEEHAKDLGSELLIDEVVGVDKQETGFRVTTRSHVTYEAKAVILALGTKKRKLNIPGQAEYEGKGIHYCATCDAPFYRNKEVAVIGGSNSAALSADVLLKFAKKVYIVYRGEELRCEPAMLDTLTKSDKLQLVLNTQLTEFKGNRFLESVTLDKPINGSAELKVDGVFVEIGGVPSSALAKQLGVEVNERGEIIINARGETNVPGVYAAGDVTNTVLRQGVVAASQGAIAATTAFRYISGKQIGSGW